MVKDLVEGLPEDVEPQPGGTFLDGPQGVHALDLSSDSITTLVGGARPKDSTEPRTPELSATMSSSIRIPCLSSGRASQAS
ncbi:MULTISPECIES: hypothetical protein [unclassified Streptomyces]|uniref:hypothetical protein n=1 Tax=unclassified Streptomyces TaxID=2593676 RepID=UPI002ED14471|nr:hypothetical protein OH827_13835 [Streptomyces sp. NBC_00891]WSY06025.1 hypothetical protein OG464_13835 [Streptomyces sp. NBC_00890]WSZ07649.1 hypothetical protein OG704_13835 [Streptomyces sp. NBC_00869]WSZ24852.1 hypothetical protein OG498_19730 [Streptomyces sp. NBC_00870]